MFLNVMAEIMMYNVRGKDQEQVPRHKEINEILARAILRKWGL